MRHGQVPEIIHDGEFYGASSHLIIKENTQTTAVILARLSLKLLYAYWRNHLFKVYLLLILQSLTIKPNWWWWPCKYNRWQLSWSLKITLTKCRPSAERAFFLPFKTSCHLQQTLSENMHYSFSSIVKYLPASAAHLYHYLCALNEQSFQKPYFQHANIGLYRNHLFFRSIKLVSEPTTNSGNAN